MVLEVNYLRLLMLLDNRVRSLNSIKDSMSAGPVVYWMSRDQRVRDNWALIFAQRQALVCRQSLLVVFCLRTQFPHATERLVKFMLEGLREVEDELRRLNIPFFFLLGKPEIQIPSFLLTFRAGQLIRDFNPLKYSQTWNLKILSKIHVPFYEVDAHNIIPVWQASSKQEYGAYTLRPKIQKLLPKYLEEFPRLHIMSSVKSVTPVNWEKILSSLKYDSKVKKPTWLNSGEKAGKLMLHHFLSKDISNYAEGRNDPTKHCQSNLSPYLHFGQLSAQRVGLELEKRSIHDNSKNAFQEELVVRRELAENYCFYNSNYDSPQGMPEWAKKTHNNHQSDPREYLYSLKILENAKTHDPLWNAAQTEMVVMGKMHGYMRMYWAKKILEWTQNIKTAYRWAIYLNDKYSLDGRDPSGYTGIAWSLGGLHDRAWFERPIFGLIRYMSSGGASNKFNVSKYIQNVENLKMLQNEVSLPKHKKTLK